MIDNRYITEICGVCGRQAAGRGYRSSSRKNGPIIWLCDDVECIEIAKDSYAMKQDEFNRIESLAAGKGGQDGGAFLEQIGKMDLASLTPEEWFEFCRRIVAGYRKALKNDLKDETPF